MKNSELWNLSGYVHKESFFQSQLKSVGVRKSKYMERYQKNYAGSKRSNLYVTLFTSLFLLVYAFLPILALITITKGNLDSSNIYDQLFSNAFLIGTYFLINFVYYFLIGFLPMMEFLQGKTFKYLRTLPMTSSDIQKVTIFTVIRMNGIQIAVIIFTVPLAILVLLKNLLLVSVFLIANILNAMFIFYSFLVISNFLSYKVFNNAKSSKLSTLIRVSVSFFQVVSMLAISYSFEFIPTSTPGNLLTNYFGTNHELAINIISSLIIFPISTAYTILLVVVPTGLIPTSILMTSALGMLLFIVLIYFLSRKGNRILSNLAYEDSSLASNESSRNIEPDMIEIKVSGPKISYIKRTLIMASREQGKLVIFILPVLFPLIFALSYSTTSSGTSASSINPFYMLFFYLAIIPYFLNNGLSEAEEGLGGLLSILPIKNRDIFRSKQYITTFMMLLSSFIYIIIIGYQHVTNNPEIVLRIIFISLIIPGINLLLYSILFGKINNHYTTFKVNTSNTAIKTGINIGFQLFLIIVLAIITVPSWLYLSAIYLVILLIIDIIIRILIR